MLLQNIYTINMCTLICYTFRSAAFYKDPPLVIHALAQELSPQKVNKIPKIQNKTG